MNKTRLEALSDGVFAIVMTLLIIEIKVPELHGEHLSEQLLWENVWNLWPLFRSYFISFIVLAMYWVSHHALFHLYVRQANRVIAHVNNLFLMFLTIVPFSAHLLGSYPHSQLAITIYGINIIALGLVFSSMFFLTINSKDLAYENLSQRLIVQGTIRILLTPTFALLAVLVGQKNDTLCMFLFAFPIVFNIIPGSLDFLENIFLKRGAKKK